MVTFFEKEPYSPIEYGYEVESILYRGKSQFQEILVVRNPYFGNMLILDGIVQLTERDEFFYHEMITHVAMHAHPAPGKVVVIGGGDGGVVREVLKHPFIEKVYLVELDEAVIRVSKEFFPTLSGDIDDPRVDVNIMDGADFIRKISSRPSHIDVMIIDPTDIIGFARSLFTDEFFELTRKTLKSDGLFVTHCESFHFHLDTVIEIQKTLRKIFPLVDLYSVPLATYPGNWWAFAVASQKINPRHTHRPCEIPTRYYDEEIHQHAFVPPKLFKKLMNRDLTW
ncbi:MAG: polyamine aminopropyltransferase [Deltaproteobacteria bacterium]|nr:polyamine aminopropyltransferase [Deltaproteobacteria bacterium]